MQLFSKCWHISRDRKGIMRVNSFTLGDVEVILNVPFSNSCDGLISQVLPVKMPVWKCHKAYSSRSISPYDVNRAQCVKWCLMLCKISHFYYDDVIWAVRRRISPATWLSVQQRVRVNCRRNTKLSSVLQAFSRYIVFGECPLQRVGNDECVSMRWRRNIVQWNLSITTTWWDTFLPSAAHLGGHWPPRWAPEGRHC